MEKYKYFLQELTQLSKTYGITLDHTIAFGEEMPTDFWWDEERQEYVY